jgi:hypothetical protein
MPLMFQICSFLYYLNTNNGGKSSKKMRFLFVLVFVIEFCDHNGADRSDYGYEHEHDKFIAA